MRPPAFALKFILAVGLAIAAGWAYKSFIFIRPRYIFVNQTTHHEYDLALKASLKIAEQKAGIENALILLDHLPVDQTIAAEAERLFRYWRIGRDRHGRGILYVYAARENQFKIEVGYALEGSLPDATVHQYEEAARTYMLSEIPQDFLSELLITLNATGQNLDPSFAPIGYLLGGAGVQSRGFSRTYADIERAIAKVAPNNDYRPTTDAAETLARYLESLSRGVGDPKLKLLTEGSAIFRLLVPRTPAQQQRVSKDYQKGLPFELVEGAEFTLAVFKNGAANLPIVLRHGTDGLWYVDEAKAWTWFHRFEDNTALFQKYANLPVSLPHAGPAIYQDRVTAPRPPRYPFSLTQALNAATTPEEKGNLYLFEMNWLRQATLMFEEAARQSPDEPRFHWRLWDLYTNGSRMEDALRELEILARLSPQDAKVREWNVFYKKAYAFAKDEF